MSMNTTGAPLPQGKPLGSQRSMYTPVFYNASQQPFSKPSAKGKERERERVKNITVPNLSSANLKRLEALSKRHIALEHVEEVPASRSNSVDDDRGQGSSKAVEETPDDDTFQQDLAVGLERKVASNPRIRRLRKKLADALKEAHHDPTHGKWEVVTHLVRLGVTMGGTRWVGARADRKPMDIGAEGIGWCNAKTEKEWFEWEKKFLHEQGLKKRVAEWTKSVVPAAPDVDDTGSSATAVEEVNEPAKTKVVDPLQPKGSQLSFSTAKRTGTAAALRTGGKPPGKHIADLSDMSMPPPSFPESQIIASTPKPTSQSQSAQAEHQQSNIFSARPLAIPSSPPIRRTYGRGSRSPMLSSPAAPRLPDPPLSPTRSVTKAPSMPVLQSPKSPAALRSASSVASPSFMNGARSRVLVPISPSRTRPKPASPRNPLKRKLSFSGQDEVAKKTRVDADDAAAADEVATPKKATALPTLTELLSSAKKARTPTRKKLRRSILPEPLSLSEATATTQDPQSIPGLTVAGPSHRPPSPQAQEIPRDPSFDSLEQSVSRQVDLNALPPGDYSIGMGQFDGLEMNPYAAGSVYDDLDLASPAKSLSSLAGSDSESEEDELHDDSEFNLEFDPQFASTQKDDQERLRAAATGERVKPGFFSSSNPFLAPLSQQDLASPRASLAGSGRAFSSSQPSAVYGKYNSQFDVRARVEEVDRLLGKDLDLDVDYREVGRATEVDVDEDEDEGSEGDSPLRRKAKDDDIFSGWLKDVVSDEDEG
ncbi:hypothetical protein DFP72DRAFT_887313 [Ephemerocybe angulata]|uniref:Uncharacterized protein n=1 Tax=Ephemerocybe angulata TaxID=980116 RepID=A0A8H6MBW6_9AGAR|nr:hypothetical protein DFP72DRAFT_887313 [Tulosesus angulatus]